MNAGQSSASQINKYTIADGLTECCWYRNGTFIGDGKVELDSEDDAATANWGSGWQIPSEAQVEELVRGDYTYTEWVKQNGVRGRRITSKSNGNSIFLPAAGIRSGTKTYYENDSGRYMSRTIYTKFEPASGDILTLEFSESKFWLDFEGRDEGQTVRSVRAR